MKKRFQKNELTDLGLPSDCDDGEVVSDHISDHGRWSVRHELIFRMPGQAEGEAWQVERVVKVWEPVE